MDNTQVHVHILLPYYTKYCLEFNAADQKITFLTSTVHKNNNLINPHTHVGISLSIWWSYICIIYKMLYFSICLIMWISHSRYFSHFYLIGCFTNMIFVFVTASCYYDLIELPDPIHTILQWLFNQTDQYEYCIG